MVNMFQINGSYVTKIVAWWHHLCRNALYLNWNSIWTKYWQRMLKCAYFHVFLVSIMPVVPFMCLGRRCLGNLVNDMHHIPRKMSIILAFAAGALLSESFEHFLPEIYRLSKKKGILHKFQNHHHHHTHYHLDSIPPGMRVILSIFLFYLLEILVRILSRNLKQNNQRSTSHDIRAQTSKTSNVHPHQSIEDTSDTKPKRNSSQSPITSKTRKSKSSIDNDNKTSPPSNNKSIWQTYITSLKRNLPPIIYSWLSLHHHHNHDNDDNDNNQCTTSNYDTNDVHNLQNDWPLAFIGLLSDFLHNLTDGMAIGLTSYSANANALIGTSLSIIAHELPHELTDMAILIRSGATINQAIIGQLMTASGAFLGCFLVRQANNISKEFQMNLMSLTAGGFIYIAIGDILPQLRHHVRSFVHLCLIASFFISGIMMHGLWL